MVKTIKTKTGLHSLSVEEMLLAYEGMIYKFAHNCVKTLSGINGNINELEDYVQLGRIEAISAFKSYKVESGNMFSTYLTNTLKYVYVHLVRDMNAKKRNSGQHTLYLNKKLDNGEEFGNLVLTDEKQEIMQQDAINELQDFLLKNLTEEEIIFLSMGLKKKMGKSKGAYRSSLVYTLDVLDNKVAVSWGTTKSDLAKELGLSRPTLNRRIDKAFEKTKELAKKYLELTY